MQKDSSHYSKNYNGFVTKNGNFIWAGAMCLAWNQLKNSIIKEPIKLATSDKSLLNMIDNFNSQRFHAKDINADSVYIKSGYGPETLKQINKQVKQKFPEKTLDPIQIVLQDDSIIAYAYLFKRLQFLTKFSLLPENNLQFNYRLKVNGFYAQKKQHRKQIKMIDYEDADNFTISINSKNPNQLIFLIKRQKKINLQQAFSLCNEQNLRNIDNKDQFMMPIIDFDLSHTINELKLPLKNQQFKTYRIQQIFQNIKLRIDQSGAKVQNQAVVAMNRMMAFSMEQPKQFILDKSFWIVMKQSGKHPYFAAFIQNPIDNGK